MNTYTGICANCLASCQIIDTDGCVDFNHE